MEEDKQMIPRAIKGVKLLKKTEVNGTPFTIIKRTGEKHKITIGNNIISTMEFENEEDAMSYIDNKPWELLANTIGLFAETIYKHMSNQNKN